MTQLSKLLALSLGGALVAGIAQAETIRLSTYVNETDIRYQGFVKFAELVAEKDRRPPDGRDISVLDLAWVVGRGRCHSGRCS